MFLCENFVKAIFGLQDFPQPGHLILIDMDKFPVRFSDFQQFQVQIQRCVDCLDSIGKGLGKKKKRAAPDILNRLIHIQSGGKHVQLIHQVRPGDPFEKIG